MKKFLLSIIFFAGVVLNSYSALYKAVSDGDWNNLGIWEVYIGPGAPTDPAAWVAASSTPGASDQAFTNGFRINVTEPTSIGVLSVENNVSDAITCVPAIDEFFGTETPSPLTIKNYLRSVSSFAGSVPTASIINTNANTILIFDGTTSAGTTGIIRNWNSSAALSNIEIDASGTLIINQNVAISGNLIVRNGTLEISSGRQITDNNGTSILTINSGATLINRGTITGNGTPTSYFDEINVNGTFTAFNYSNFTTVNAGSTGTIDVNFVGANQTQGWWYQTSAPTFFNLDNNSTVNYAANTTQNFFALSSGGGYGILNLSASSAVDKNLTGAGQLFVKNQLNISGASNLTSSNGNPIILQGNLSNNGTWNTTQPVYFTGSNNQVINGSSPITFGQEVRIDKSGGIVTLQLVNQNINANLRILNGTFRPLAQTVTLNGNIINDGTIEATQNGAGGFIFTGNTEISSPAGTGVTQFRNVTINSGASLAQEIGGEFEVTTNFTNNGTFNHNDGLVRFRQSGTKNIAGTSKTSFYDLSVEGGTVNIDGSVDLENVMTFAGSPTIDFDGGGSGVFTLKSVAGRDAAIGNVGTASFSGNLNVERYLNREDITDEGFHIMSFPVVGATVADIQADIPVNGNFTNASGYTDGTFSATNPSIYRYIETLGGGIRDRYSPWPTTDNSAAFNVGEGYHVFTYDGFLPVSVIGNGTLFKGDFSMPLSYTGSEPDAGWHAISNPYPAPTDWTQWGKTNVNGGTAHLYDPETGNYIPLDGVGQDLIPQGQGFFVKVNASGSVSATEATKVTGSTPIFYRNANSPLPRFEIILRKDSIEDVAIVSFNENATDNYESAYDADRLLNVRETLSTLTKDGKAVKVNRLANFGGSENCSRSFFLNLEQMVTGRDYELDFRDLENISSQSFTLIDHYLGNEVNVSTNSPYVFNVTTETASKGSTRFELILSNKVPENISVFAEDVCPNDASILNIERSQDFVDYLVFKNNELISSIKGNGTTLDIEIDNSFITDSASNDFVIKAFVNGCDTVQVGSATVQVLETLSLNNEVIGSKICKVENEAFFSVATQVNASYFILDGQDTIGTFQGNGNLYEGFINSTELVDGINEFVIAVDKEGCQSGTLNQKLQIEVDNPTIDQTIAFSTMNSCYKTPSTVSFTGQAGVQYEIYKGTSLVASTTGDGTEQVVEIPAGNLSLGTNDFRVIAKYGECAELEFAEPVQILVEENINPNLSLVTENICGNNNTSVIVENAQAGKIYTLKTAENNISTLTATESGTLTFNLNSNQLINGLNEFDIQIEGEYCGVVNSTNKAQITVYEPINTSLNYAVNSSCSVAEVSVGIQNAQAAKTYYLYSGETLVQTVVAAEAGNIVFENANDFLTIGQNEFRVEIEGEGCGIEIAPQTMKVSLFEEINAQLELTSTDVCYGENVVIEIANPQIDKTYSLKNADGVITSKVAASTDALSFTISSEQFALGTQDIAVEISDANCGTVVANSTSFTLYEPVNNDLIYLAANTCNVSEAVVGIQNAQQGKTYKLYKNQVLVEIAQANLDGELVFQQASDNLEIGLNEFNVEIEGESCGIQTALAPIQLELFESINTDLNVMATNICKGEDQYIEISNPQVNKTYRLISASGMELGSKVSGSESPLSFVLPADQFEFGYQELQIEIADDNCGTLSANSAVTFEVFESAIINSIENQNICVSGSATIDLSANVPMASYQLFIGDELVLDENTTVLNLSPAESTTYTLTGISASGCAVNSLNFTVEVTDLATPGILVSANVLESSVEGDSYQWYLDGVVLEGETGKVLVAQLSGDYTVEVGKANCTKVSDAYTFSEEVLNANKALANALNLYPNPVVDKLTVDMENIDEVEVSIYTVSGRFMDRIELDKKSGNTIDMSKFGKGVYLLQLNSGKGSVTKRIIKQ
ncbi:T9SS type A sorting domain-containing protein [Marivirga sp.]|uniref:T9SS type A sorting domain-containing protein n=1 Tax=Marivirga sp. TaxID=2018662 RepID=UPI002D7EA501|nr:T9SS type A sorting domain-containing protein [Marivirga sp.]HET8858955.1 T9SS type A sorting domain-containing protein [Marivirga sp.]